MPASGTGARRGGGGAFGGGGGLDGWIGRGLDPTFFFFFFFFPLHAARVG